MKLILISLFIFSIIFSSGYAEETETKTTRNISDSQAGFGGFSAGTPGAINCMGIFDPNLGKNFHFGFGITLSLLTLIENGSDTDKSSKNDNRLFYGAQISFPFFLINQEKYFIALSPLAGFDKYKPDNGKSGYWIYGGGAVDIFLWGLFVEAGAGFGPRKNITGAGIHGWNKNSIVTLLFNVGYVFRFRADDGIKRN